MRYLSLLGLSFVLLTTAFAAKPPTAKTPRPEITPPPAGEAITELAPAVKKRLRASCFEVVVPRPEKDSLTYEKELPWDQVAFHIRNDKYVSIGTAFAVSQTELITAFHVLDLNQELLSYPRYFIRDGEQKVYEIDQILLAHEHRDVVRFTVKNRTFDQWLELKPEYEMNRPVFTAGNAYGEGIVVRRGDLIGTLPEPMDGAWSWLKSSADVNAGNSGGPLLDAQGRVIGVVVQRKDNLSYSLPVAELKTLKPSVASYYNKITYSFNLFPEKSKPLPSAFELALPMAYQEVKRQAYQKRQSSYERDMEALFAEQKELFPKGSSSLEVIHDIPNSAFLEMVFKDPNSSRWAITDVKTNKFDVGNNGSLNTASACGLLLLHLRRPDTITYADLMEKPRVAMDLVFKALNIPRELGGEKVRITSLGEPMRTLEYRDRYGRPWRLAAWHMEFSDKVLLLFSTSTPSGLVGVLQETTSPKVDTWIYDLKKTLDFVYVPYSGQLKEWGPFLSQRPEQLPEAFKEIQFRFEAGKVLQLRSPWLNLEVDSRTHTLTPTDNLGLFMGFNPLGHPSAWELRRIVVAEDEGDNYFVWIKHLKPEAGLNEGAFKGWREIAQNRHPYTRSAFAKEGRTDISTVLPTFLPKGTAPEEASSLYTLYVGRTGTVPERAMKKVMETITDGLKPGASIR